MPSSQFVIEEFVPRRGLRGGHTQTIASFLLRRRFRLPAPERRLVEVEPGTSVLCECHWQRENRSRAMTLVALHGLEGSSESGYMLGIAEKGLKLGMNVVLMNQRNCGGESCETTSLYHSGRSGDVAAVAKHLVDTDKVERLSLVGYSMGGNIVLKCAGEYGAQAPVQLKGVAVACPALDLAASADALHLRGNRLYESYFVWRLRRRLKEKAQQNPGQYDVGRLTGIKTLREFDDKITAYYSGFRGADDYYFRAAAARVVDNIAVPTLVLHAKNDPFVRITAETRAKLVGNPNIRLV
ncbi:MAG: alpha/beta fold hydrolase, partial [Acidobacteriales bacterium]|nr:alpha/beta fold hydrolase [Terriglobales bacterium]